MCDATAAAFSNVVGNKNSEINYMERRLFMRNSALALFAAGFGGIPNFIAQAANNKKIVAP